MIKTLLLTDIVDSTKMTQEVGDQRMAQIWIAHDRIARDLLSKFNGLEIDRTDGFLMLFDSVSDAIHYAHQMHDGLRGLSEKEGLPIKARIGIHYGEIILIEQSEEDQATGARSLGVEGIAKPLAARVMSVAGGAQTLISYAAFEALGDLGDIRLISHGHWRMKGVAEPVELFEVGSGDTNFKRPLDTEKVYRVHLQDDLWVPVQDIKHNLPSERDVFVGREKDLQALYNELDSGAHLVTIVGTAGTGKTRFVRRFAWNWLGDYPGGVWFCDLSEVRSLEGIVSAVSRTLDISLRNNEPVELIGNAIKGRGRCLIVLDNFEQVTDLAPETLGRWIDLAPKACFIATSRNVLNLRGEHLIHLDPLPVKTDGVALFVVRAKARNKRFELNASNQSDVESIVNTLDGLPLAIELAAARIGILSPSQLKNRLAQRFKILAGAKGKSSRQATLKAAIDWSWELLEPWEKSALAQCSAFDGGFTLRAVESVVLLDDQWPDAPWPMDVVQALLDKSLLKMENSRMDIDEPWFGMYVSVQEYSKEKLRTSGAFEGSGPELEQESWARHGAYFAEFGEADFLQSLYEHNGKENALLLAADQENLITACNRAIARQDAGHVVSLLKANMEVIKFRGPYEPISLLAQSALTIPGLTDADQMDIHGVLANSLRYQGKLPEAKAHFEKALELARKTHNRQSEGLWLGNLGILSYYQGSTEDASSLYEEATEIAREVGDLHSESLWQGNLGVLFHNGGRLSEAQEKYQLALNICKRMGDLRNESFWEGNLGVFLHHTGQLADAEQTFISAHENAGTIGDHRTSAYWKGSLGTLYYDQGKFSEAKECFDFALEGAKNSGDILLQGYWLGNIGVLMLDRGEPDGAEQKFTEALRCAMEGGDRFDECRWMGGLANVYLDRNELHRSRKQFEAALVIAKDVGDKLLEGRMMGYIGMLMIALDNDQKGIGLIESGEKILREVGDKKELGILLALKSKSSYLLDQAENGLSALKEARRLALDVGTSPGSELGKLLAAVDEMLKDPKDVASEQTAAT